MYTNVGYSHACCLIVFFVDPSLFIYLFTLGSSVLTAWSGLLFRLLPMQLLSHTVDREFFTVKIFRQLLRWRKLNAQKFIMCSFNFRHLATWRKLNTRTFLTRKKKSYAKIFWSMVVQNTKCNKSWEGAWGWGFGGSMLNLFLQVILQNHHNLCNEQSLHASYSYISMPMWFQTYQI